MPINFVQPGHYDGTNFVADTFRARDVIASDGVSAETHITDAGIHLTAEQKALLADAGAANGAATLDSSGKLSVTQIPAGITGGLTYQSAFDPAAGQDAGGTAIPAPSAANKGWYWIAGATGSYTPPGNSAAIGFEIGDWLVSNGETYDEIDNTTADLTAREAASAAQSEAEKLDFLYAEDDADITANAERLRNGALIFKKVSNAV